MTAQYLAIDAATVRASIARLMEVYPELAEDNDLALDMFEGETDLFKVVSRAVNGREDALAMVAAIKERQDKLAARRTRFEKKAEALKSIIQGLMDAADQEKIEFPEATLFVTKPRESVDVTDVEALPQGFYRMTKSADKTALKAALMAGETIPGAELKIGLAGLTIRVK